MSAQQRLKLSTQHHLNHALLCLILTQLKYLNKVSLLWTQITSLSPSLYNPQVIDNANSDCKQHTEICPDWLGPSVLSMKMTKKYLGCPGGSRDKESACRCRRCKRLGFSPWTRKIPWSRKWQTTPVFLPGKFYGQRSLVGCSPQGHKDLDTLSHWAHMHV